MYFARNIGGLALIAAMLWLAACSGTPEAGTEPKMTPEQTQMQMPEQTPEQTQAAQPAATTEPLQETEPSSTDQPLDQEGLPPTVEEAATTVIRSIKNKDMKQLAAWVHGEKGLRFSPYAHVDTKKDLVFTRDEVEGLMNDSTKRVWRTFAGTGDLIEMTFADYYKRFVYDADFMQMAETAVNKGLGQGATINNLNEVYPKDQYDFVEYHIAGIDPSVEGMDWRSLRLVFEKIGEDHALVGIIHDQWTP
ncbi:hypothetical protein MHB77_26090 [Paenibacillus sp. FSL K6-3166]|uniref:hypothetical protein n=1 Tax=unclassified Paenibacillus TaxID=185978 RepID=UPI000BA16FDC|nr:hypothetical protein [Paenibacillus sp. VTT E-133291]OZQ94750.1 hypothetical protein CA598_09070 [Paenibacillus sp. VTT E-133291]